MSSLGLQATTEAIVTLNMITVIEELIRFGFCAECPPCMRTEAKMNTVLDAKAEAGRVALVNETMFIFFIFTQAFPGVSFPAPTDPRVVAIKAAVDKMKAGN